jgi:hypothetical protein
MPHSHRGRPVESRVLQKEGSKANILSNIDRS